MFTELKFDTEIIQSTHIGHHAIYGFKNVFSEKYLQKILSKTKELTAKDTLNQTTNVKANMTSYEKLLEEGLFNEYHSTILSLLKTCICLRAVHHRITVNAIVESWAMKHEEGQETVLHSHMGRTWSGCFCIESDENASELIFPDLNVSTSYSPNTLYFWPSNVLHMTSEHKSKNPRYTLAFNTVDMGVLNIVERQIKP